MLEVCNGGQTDAEYRSQFSTWAILASPLILGHDPRSQSAACLAIITNKDVIAVSQDRLALRGTLVYQWPDAKYTAVAQLSLLPSGVANRRASSDTRTPHDVGGNGTAPSPPLVAALTMATCDPTSPFQRFTYDAATSTVRAQFNGTTACLTYGGYVESNTTMNACTGWTAPGIGSQLWTVDAATASLRVVDNPGKGLDVVDCNFNRSDSVQVCTLGGADCYSSSSPPPGCGLTGQAWMFNVSAHGGSTIASMAAPPASHCISVVPMLSIKLQIWAKALDGGAVSALAFNRDTAPLRANITTVMLGWPANATIRVYDLWARAELGLFTGVVSAVVPPHDVFMVRATRV